MIKGLNIDITNSPPDPEWLAHIGCAAVRFPSRPGIDEYISELHFQHVQTFAVLDTVAGGFICGGGECTAYQITNEPDGSAGASGKMPIEQCREELRLYRETYPELVLIGPGLSAGDYSGAYLLGIRSALREYRYAAWAIHPYGKTPTTAASLFTAHQKIVPEMPGMLTECHPEADDMRQFHRSAATAGASAVFYHCYCDQMTASTEGINYGLVDMTGGHKRDLDLWLFA